MTNLDTLRESTLFIMSLHRSREAVLVPASPA